MGAVHGVHLKYAAMSALCATGAMHHSRQRDEQEELISPILVGILVYSALIHALITALFVSRRGEWVIGKNAQTGTVPLWSFLVFFPFHLPTWLYTSVHTEISKRKGVPVASEVAPGWWIGGCYAAQLERRWAATVDLTVEFSEGCFQTSTKYLLVACWDGTPPPPREIESAANFAASASQQGDVLVHCAHGRGRSTCVMVACLVRAGLFPSWREAFESCRKHRKGIKLNGKMTRALDEWETTYNPNVVWEKVGAARRSLAR